MDGLKFGTSGLRGLVEELGPEVCAAYTRAFLRHLGGAGSPPAALLIGHDLRDSSPAIASHCSIAATSLGVDVIDLGAAPTPAIALEAMRRNLPAIMVTGSHIPADRNGLKFYRPDGEISKDDERGIAARLAADPPPNAQSGSLRHDDSARERYAARYLAMHGFDLHGLTVGVYQHSSVARDMIADILAGLGARPVLLGRSDVFVPVDTEALRPEDVDLAARWASEHRLDALVTTDGDADRPLIADEKGIYLRGDVVGILTARTIGARTVVTPVTSTSAVEACGYFDRVLRTKVGSPYVIEGMAGVEVEAQPVVGFEANGGVLLGSDVELRGVLLEALPTRDAVLPIIAVLSLVKARGCPLSALVGELPERFTASDRLKEVPAEASAHFLGLLSSRGAIEVFLAVYGILSDVDRTDGVRLTLDRGRTLHFRASGNAPELRCYAEATTPKEAEALLSWGLSKARSAITLR